MRGAIYERGCVAQRRPATSSSSIAPTTPAAYAARSRESKPLPRTSCPAVVRRSASSAGKWSRWLNSMAKQNTSAAVPRQTSRVAGAIAETHHTTIAAQSASPRISRATGDSAPPRRCTSRPRAIVPRAIRVDRNVGDVRIEIGWLNSRDPLTVRRLRQIACQFGPFATVILCNPEPPIIRPSPQKTSAFRRLGKRKDDPVIFRAASGGVCFSRIVVGEVGTDHRIFFHPVGELEDAVATKIDHPRFMPAHDHW